LLLKSYEGSWVGVGMKIHIHMVTASDKVWEAYIEVCINITVSLYASHTWWAHPKAVWWHDKPFPLYNDIAPLVEGWHATGDHVI